MKRHTLLLSAVLCAILAIACSDGKEEAKAPAGPAGGTDSVETAEPARELEEAREDTSIGFSPAEPKAAGKVRLLVGPYKVSSDKVEWYLNGTRVRGVSGLTLDLKAAGAYRDDKLSAVITVGETRLRSVEVTLGNSPPRISAVTMLPENFKPGDTLYVIPEAEDADEDNVEFAYSWTVNDQPAGDSDRMDRQISRGDRFQVSIRPYDGTDYGEEVLIERDIGNMPPMLELHYEYSFDGTTYTYAARATDPDGDPLTFGLKSAPKGMAIDPSTGVVTWEVPVDFIGRAEYVITAEDPSGGRSEMEMAFTLKEAE